MHIFGLSSWHLYITISNYMYIFLFNIGLFSVIIQTIYLKLIDILRDNIPSLSYLSHGKNEI